MSKRLFVDEMSGFFSAIMLTFISALFFLIGYSYLYSYFEFYAIFPSELELSLQDILVYSFGPISAAFEQYFLVMFAGLISAYGLMLFGLNFGAKESFIAMIINGSLVSIFLILILSLFGSSALGRKNAENDLTSLNLAMLVGQNTDENLENFFGDDHDYSIRHLISTSSTHYLILLYQAGSDKWTIRQARDASSTLAVYQD